MALLTLPVAQELVPWLTIAEREPAQITARLVDSNEVGASPDATFNFAVRRDF